MSLLLFIVGWGWGTYLLPIPLTRNVFFCADECYSKLFRPRQGWIAMISDIKFHRLLCETVDVVVDGRCHPTEWRYYPDINIEGGHIKRSFSSLQACKSQCIADSQCTAIDWDGDCYFHGPWTAATKMTTKNGVGHYELGRKYCTGKLNAWL